MGIWTNSEEKEGRKKTENGIKAHQAISYMNVSESVYVQNGRACVHGVRSRIELETEYHNFL